MHVIFFKILMLRVKLIHEHASSIETCWNHILYEPVKLRRISKILFSGEVKGYLVKPWELHTWLCLRLAE